MGEVLRYDIYEAWNGSMNIDIDQDGGEWVSYEDHAKEIATLRAKLRIFLRRRDSEWEEGDDLRAENERLLDEAYNARQSAKGENALRLEAERERDALRADVERWVKEVAHLKLSAEKAERISNEPSR